MLENNKKLPTSKTRRLSCADVAIYATHKLRILEITVTACNIIHFMSDPEANTLDLKSDPEGS